MGNKRSRDLTRPKERDRPCVCDVFDLTAACEADALVLSLSTDLPVGTRVAVAAHRLLRESDGQQWHWTCLEDVVPVTPQPHGLNGFVLHATRDDLDGKGLHMYRHLRRAMSVVIAAVPSTSLEVSASAPTDLHRFGLCNRRLEGKAVTVRPSGHSLERSVQVAVPTSEAVMRQLGLGAGPAGPGAAEGGGG
ncbi:MAG TPA: hypothetical protein VH092_22110 [Urbifossiella sp.]|jgi:hypothetical protein|nr:hypothetical protein [Urbifossiella sp.]